MAILARSPKSPIFWISAKGGPLCRKWHYPRTSMLLRCKDWTRFLRRRRLQTCPNGEVIAIYARSPKTRIFWKSAKGEREGEGKFFKNRPKSSPRFKGPRALWRKWHYPLITSHLTCKEWKWFWRIQRLQKCPGGQVIAILCKVTQNPHFLKKCKGETRRNFSKIAQKRVLVWKA